MKDEQNDIIIKLSKYCSNMVLNKKVVRLSELYEEIIQLVLDSNCDNEIKITLLTQLYRYGYYNDVMTSIDPRVDQSFKYQTLKNIKDVVLENSFTDEKINHIKEYIDMLRAHIDNPVEFIENEMKFYKEDPGAKF